MKKRKSILILISIMFILFVCLNTYSKATSTVFLEETAERSLRLSATTSTEIEPNDYKPDSPPRKQQIESVSKLAGVILGAVIVIGRVMAVIALAVMGIKYMMGSVSEKAEYKKSMIPYLIGVVFVVATTTILNIIEVLVKNVS